MSKIKLSKEFIRSTVKLALNEDLYPSGDITSSLINNDKVVTVKLISKKRNLIFIIMMLLDLQIYGFENGKKYL